MFHHAWLSYMDLGSRFQDVLFQPSYLLCFFFPFLCLPFAFLRYIFLFIMYVCMYVHAHAVILMLQHPCGGPVKICESILSL